MISYLVYLKSLGNCNSYRAIVDLSQFYTQQIYVCKYRSQKNKPELELRVIDLVFLQEHKKLYFVPLKANSYKIYLNNIYSLYSGVLELKKEGNVETSKKDEDLQQSEDAGMNTFLVKSLNIVGPSWERGGDSLCIYLLK